MDIYLLMPQKDNTGIWESPFKMNAVPVCSSCGSDGKSSTVTHRNGDAVEYELKLHIKLHSNGKIRNALDLDSTGELKQRPYAPPKRQ